MSNGPNAQRYETTGLNPHRTGDTTTRPLKYWAMLGVIRVVMREPAAETLMDMLFEPPRDTPNARRFG